MMRSSTGDNLPGEQMLYSLYDTALYELILFVEALKSTSKFVPERSISLAFAVDLICDRSRRPASFTRAVGMDE